MLRSISVTAAKVAAERNPADSQACITERCRNRFFRQLIWMNRLDWQ